MKKWISTVACSYLLSARYNFWQGKAKCRAQRQIRRASACLLLRCIIDFKYAIKFHRIQMFVDEFCICSVGIYCVPLFHQMLFFCVVGLCGSKSNVFYFSCDNFTTHPPMIIKFYTLIQNWVTLSNGLSVIIVWRVWKKYSWNLLNFFGMYLVTCF